MLKLDTPTWSALAKCREVDPDELFVQGAEQNRAKVICQACPVRTECLSDALDNQVEFGVWGGMTERERRAILKRRPHVRSWKALLENARDEHERMEESRGNTPDRLESAAGAERLVDLRAHDEERVSISA